MKTRTGLVVIAGIALTAGLARADDAWKKIENKSFSFSVPANFQKIKVHGIDSFVEKYEADGIRLSFDYGMYSNSFSGWPKETKFETVKINGV